MALIGRIFHGIVCLQTISEHTHTHTPHVVTSPMRTYVHVWITEIM